MFPKKLQGILITAVTVAVVIMIVNRVDFLRKLVYGS